MVPKCLTIDQLILTDLKWEKENMPGWKYPFFSPDSLYLPPPPPTVPKLSFLWALKYSCSQNWHGGNKENVSTIVIRLVSNKYLWSIVNCTVCAYV